MKEKLVPVLIGVVIGVVLAPKLTALPGLNKLPQV
jgi:hypothetical protein